MLFFINKNIDLINGETDYAISNFTYLNLSGLRFLVLRDRVANLTELRDFSLSCIFLMVKPDIYGQPRVNFL